MPNVQIFGAKDSQPTRAAQRFFKERSIPFQFVDLKQKAMAPAEIKRFIERFGLSSLLDREGKTYIEAGIQYLKLTETELLAKIERDPKLLLLPLVRSGKHLAIGQNEKIWKEMLAD